MNRFISLLGCACVLSVTAAAARAQCSIGWSWVEPPASQDAHLSDLDYFGDGSSRALFVCDAYSGVARLDGDRWTPLGGPSGTRSMCVFDDGTGASLYAFFLFSFQGPLETRYGARWDGSQWLPFDLDIEYRNSNFWLSHNSFVLDDGGGEALYLVGWFESINGVPVNGLAKWDGLAWHDVGGGVTWNGGPGIVASLAMFDDGDGPRLYAGGTFDHAGGVAASNIARWDGTRWRRVRDGVGGGSLDPQIQCMTVYDDGAEPALYCGGLLQQPGKCLAKWDGDRWSTIGDVEGLYVATLEVFDTGHGSELYVGGRFEAIAGQEFSNVARWDGQRWGALGDGIGRRFDSVITMAEDEAATNPAVFVAGSFRSAGSVPADGIARWGCVPGDMNCDAVLSDMDIEPLILALTDPAGYTRAYPDCDRDLADLNFDGAVDAFDIEAFTRALP